MGAAHREKKEMDFFTCKTCDVSFLYKKSLHGHTCDYTGQRLKKIQNALQQNWDIDSIEESIETIDDVSFSQFAQNKSLLFEASQNGTYLFQEDSDLDSGG